MRIIGGRLRGMKLAELGAGDQQAHLRPTSDRVREAMFNLLINSIGLELDGIRVLDLFAGTGALGLEALSRGAARIAFVDDGAKSRALLRENIEKARAMGSTDVWRRDATRLGPNRSAGYGLIFMDPPYGKALGEAALRSAEEGNWLADDAVIVWEESNPPEQPAGFRLLDQRRYGDTLVTVMRHEKGALAPPLA
ncbi:16S rRNA (guanine(966)-N(2))-methyltransferase RsmD [Paracoccus sp. SCSIO 75233]|uniref:16S rRNA (guanine(966)-N(2))-methyltransferase RsmD n=1 Tax=Paracoccus sp. SCSIO 75233 TaxID=3017782 RepID=UPI0022F0FBCB|nr:16S rRNA (guanine(966)-N(2))-methyltransferase RsmD [Paracoccus sp. SCSIO 75233]WBU53569.1 16S rRNA (guanine(966)-N(2))-methyltransferase RsmD [Paracoccus sp. SCSIO 75233]